jgi:hypothetical protein
MKRFCLLLRNEFKLFRTTIPIHMIGFFQPALMFSLITFILVKPTFNMRVLSPTTSLGEALVTAMKEVGSPIGEKYINPILVDSHSPMDLPGGQVIAVETLEGKTTAVQRFGLIDSNIIKNYRNRLTAAALTLWNASLDGNAITIQQHPWLPRDIPYTLYFGMAMLPLAAFLSAALIGAFLTAQEFEFKTILEYRLSPISMSLIIGTRLVRLSLTGLFSAVILMIVLGVISGFWPSSLIGGFLIFLGIATLGGCMGTITALLLQSTLPSFVINLAAAFSTWILGSAFGLSAGFGGAYEAVSRWMPNTYAVELLFPLYYQVDIGMRQPAIIVLSTACVLMILITMFTYRQKVLVQQR